MIHLLNLTKEYRYSIKDEKTYLHISITIGDDCNADGASKIGQVIRIDTDDCERLDIMIDADATRDSIANALQSLADGIRNQQKKNQAICEAHSTKLPQD